MCKSCRTCFMFYCMFYFTCDRSLMCRLSHCLTVIHGCGHLFICCTKNIKLLQMAWVLWPPGSCAGRAGHYVSLLSFICLFLSFAAPNLRGRSVDRHQTYPHVPWWSTLTKFRYKFGASLAQKKWRPKNIKISAISLTGVGDGAGGGGGHVPPKNSEKYFFRAIIM